MRHQNVRPTIAAPARAELQDARGHVHQSHRREVRAQLWVESPSGFTAEKAEDALAESRTRPHESISLHGEGNSLPRGQSQEGCQQPHESDPQGDLPGGREGIGTPALNPHVLLKRTKVQRADR